MRLSISLLAMESQALLWEEGKVFARFNRRAACEKRANFSQAQTISGSTRHRFFRSGLACIEVHIVGRIVGNN